MKQVIRTKAAPAAIGPYSQGILAGEFLFVSGQLGIDPETKKLVDGGIEAEARRALKNVAAICEAAGTTMAAVVKTTVLLQSMDDFAVLNEVYATFFGEAPPARATYQVGRLPLGALVEIEAIARIGR